MMMVIREWMIDHLEIESTVLHKESEEAQIQMQREGANKLGEHLNSVCKILGGNSLQNIHPWVTTVNLSV